MKTLKTDEEKYEAGKARPDERLEITLLESEMAHVYIPKYTEGCYTVRFPKGTNVMSCNCQAREYCKHRALVHEALLARTALSEIHLTDANWRNEYAQLVLGCC